MELIATVHGFMVKELYNTLTDLTLKPDKKLVPFLFLVLVGEKILVKQKLAYKALYFHFSCVKPVCINELGEYLSLQPSQPTSMFYWDTRRTIITGGIIFRGWNFKDRLIPKLSTLFNTHHETIGHAYYVTDYHFICSLI